MGKKQKYSIDFKLQVVGKYEQGKYSYKRLLKQKVVQFLRREEVGA